MGAAGPALRLIADNDTRAVTWRDFALCQEFNGDLWFAEGERKNGGDYRQAKAVCGACPVTGPCLEYALAIESRPGIEAYGVYGGKSANERRAIIRQRRKAAA